MPHAVIVDSRTLAAMRAFLEEAASAVPEPLRLKALAAGLGFSAVLSLRAAVWERPLRPVDSAAFSAELAKEGWIAQPALLARAVAAAGGPEGAAA